MPLLIFNCFGYIEISLYFTCTLIKFFTTFVALIMLTFLYVCVHHFCMTYGLVQYVNVVHQVVIKNIKDFLDKA